MASTTAELNSIPKQAFIECFQRVESHEDHFEDDSNAPSMPIFFFFDQRSDTFLTDIVLHIDIYS